MFILSIKDGKFEKILQGTMDIPKIVVLSDKVQPTKFHNHAKKISEGLLLKCCRVKRVKEKKKTSCVNLTLF